MWCVACGVWCFAEDDYLMAQHVEFIEANLSLAAHQKDVLALTAAYALDPMGNGGPLPAEALERLIPGLRNHPTTLILLAYLNGRAVGIATCFRGFSTFYAQPLLNIHDLAVLPEFRGMRIGARLLAMVEHHARQLGCCKVTLEVQENNHRARQVYERGGFTHAHYSTESGGSLFYQKLIE